MLIKLLLANQILMLEMSLSAFYFKNITNYTKFCLFLKDLFTNKTHTRKDKTQKPPESRYFFKFIVSFRAKGCVKPSTPPSEYFLRNLSFLDR